MIIMIFMSFVNTFLSLFSCIHFLGYRFDQMIVLFFILRIDTLILLFHFHSLSCISKISLSSRPIPISSISTTPRRPRSHSMSSTVSITISPTTMPISIEASTISLSSPRSSTNSPRRWQRSISDVIDPSSSITTTRLPVPICSWIC